MRCKCGGKLVRLRGWGAHIYECEKCGRRWELDYTLAPIIGMEPVDPPRPPVYQLE